MEENNKYIISFQKLVEGRVPEFDNSKKIKLIRHLDNREVKLIDGKEYRESLYTLYRTRYDVFLKYQNEQYTSRFKDVEYIVSFIGEEKNTARFVGVFKNCNRIDLGNDNSVFDFQKVVGFEALEEKVVIDWVNRAIDWHQWYDTHIKYVVRIDRGMSEGDIPIFTSYEDVMLNYHQLKAIFEKNDTEWRAKLEACNCVYLILDKKTGKQYVGVTYRNKQSSGKGIWGRWNEYVETNGHGNDKSLLELYKQDNAYPATYFQWSILEILPLNVTDKVAIDRESLYKEKFGTREHGYNNN